MYSRGRFRLYVVGYLLYGVFLKLCGPPAFSDCRRAFSAPLQNYPFQTLLGVWIWQGLKKDKLDADCMSGRCCFDHFGLAISFKFFIIILFYSLYFFISKYYFIYLVGLLITWVPVIYICRIWYILLLIDISLRFYSTLLRIFLLDSKIHPHFLNHPASYIVRPSQFFIFKMTSLTHANYCLSHTNKLCATELGPREFNPDNFKLSKSQDYQILGHSRCTS